MCDGLSGRGVTRCMQLVQIQGILYCGNTSQALYHR